MCAFVMERTHMIFSVKVANNDALLGPSWIIDITVAGGACGQQAC